MTANWTSVFAFPNLLLEALIGCDIVALDTCAHGRLRPLRHPKETRMMERSEILPSITEPKHYGMKATFNIIIGTAI